jgi:hypothetical protein
MLYITKVYYCHIMLQFFTDSCFFQ